MTDTVISIENLSKRYLVGHRDAQRGKTTLRDVIVREAHNFTRKAVDVFRGRQIVQGDRGRGVLGAEKRELRGQARRGRRYYRPKWRGQKYAAENSQSHHGAD